MPDAALEERIRRWTGNGVRFVLPGSVWIDEGVVLAPGVVIEAGSTLRGKTVVEAGAVIGPGTDLIDARVGAGATVVRSVVSSSQVGEASSIGPFARLRGGTKVGKGCRVGSFVEIKASVLEDGAKAAHLSYLGDATVGEGANIGAGTITCNYDGRKKHTTRIGEGAFVGSDAILVAPVSVGKGAWVAAGSVITKDIPDGALGIGRGRQRNVRDWARRRAGGA